jgi:hypothetical protein
MRTLCFIIERLEFVGSEKFMIAGRNCRDELRRGDRLHVHSKIGTQSAAEFCIDEITWYDRTVPTVDHGHTAGLLFPNDLAAHVRLGDELHGQSDA